MRLLVENKVLLSEKDIDCLLDQSEILSRLTHESSSSLLATIFKLVGLSEIPYSQRLNETQKVIDRVNREVATPEGFSYTGEVDGIIPCYNAMLLEAYARLVLANSPEAIHALNWIKKYQLFERYQTTTWSGKGFGRHGGCLKGTPCYIGIGKTVRALLTYQEFADNQDPVVVNLLNQGLNYMLNHQLFLRRSTNQPISPHITDTMFPQNYCLSFTDLVYIVGKTQSQNKPLAQAFMKKFAKKELSHQWKVDYIYRAQGYVPFDNWRRQSPWLSILFNVWWTHPFVRTD